jgi:hypothetical protein
MAEEIEANSHNCKDHEDDIQDIPEFEQRCPVFPDGFESPQVFELVLLLIGIFHIMNP